MVEPCRVATEPTLSLQPWIVLEPPTRTMPALCYNTLVFASGVSIAPGLILSLLFAGAHAAGFKLIMGQHARRFPLCWVISLVGFLVGQVVAENFGEILIIATPQIGDVHWIEASLTAWLAAFIVARRSL